MRRFLKSVSYALNGWRLFFSRERNGQIQAMVGILVVAAGLFFRLKAHEWMMILFCLALVLALEMVNSVIETLVNHLHPQQHENIKWVKDVAAGAVLWAAVLSSLIGAIIFIPKILLLFSL